MYGSRRERGAVLVEFALVVPLLAAFLLGIINFGMGYNRLISMNNATRESARYGSVQSVDGDLEAWLHRTADVAISSAAGDMAASVADQVICVAYVHPDGSTAEDRSRKLVETGGVRVISDGTCITDSRPDDERRVQIVLNRSTDVNAIIYQANLPLSAYSVSRFERGSQ